MPGRVLSIVIPAYNEERFIGTLLEKIRAVDLTPLGLDKEIIVIDDHSSDGTAGIVESVPGVILRRQPQNGGKGSAVRAGLALATGDFVIIQDADLEYEPQDYLRMLEALLPDGPDRTDGIDAVYGSRYMHARGNALRRLLRNKSPNQSWAAYLGGRSISLIALVLTGRYLTDTVTALKLFRREVLAPLALETTGFELDHEITAKVLARGGRIVEVPIRYFPRSRQEGKKIGLKDWFRAARTFFRYRRG